MYTPLHGVGHGCAGETLEAAGFKLIPVPEQAEPNGQFPNVTKTPNPEVRECLDRAEKVAREQQADLVIATDPDADRLGGLACTSPDGRGDYRFLTGQELASLLTYFKLSRLAARGISRRRRSSSPRKSRRGRSPGFPGTSALKW